MFTKSDLKDGDIVTQRSGEKKIVVNQQRTLRGLYDSGCSSVEYYTENLLIKDNENKYDIIKVERPCQYKKVYERKETEELTIAEAEKKFEKLGLNIKII